jgi:hypothetical protein
MFVTGLGMPIGGNGTVFRMALMVAIALMMTTTVATAAGPPPCEPPAGYLPPDVDLRVVGLLEDQRVAVGTTHRLEAEALDTDGKEWGERFDWYVDGEHRWTGSSFDWAVSGPPGERRVTLVASMDGDAVWTHLDVSVGMAMSDPPSWLGPLVRAVPYVALAVWFLLLERRIARRRDPKCGSG